MLQSFSKEYKHKYKLLLNATTELCCILLITVQRCSSIVCKVVFKSYKVAKCVYNTEIHFGRLPSPVMVVFFLPPVSSVFCLFMHLKVNWYLKMKAGFCTFLSYCTNHISLKQFNIVTVSFKYWVVAKTKM